MIFDQVFDSAHLERNAHRDAKGSYGEQLDHPFHPDWTVRPDPLQRREPDHLRAIKEQMPRTAFARIDDKLGYGLAEQLPDRLPYHLIGDVEGVNVNDFAGVLLEFGQRGLPFQIFRLSDGSNHTQNKIP